MFPVSASGLGRCTTEPTVLGGYLVPAGVEVQARAELAHMRLISRIAPCMSEDGYCLPSPRQVGVLQAAEVTW